MRIATEDEIQIFRLTVRRLFPDVIVSIRWRRAEGILEQSFPCLTISGATATQVIAIMRLARDAHIIVDRSAERHALRSHLMAFVIMPVDQSPPFRVCEDHVQAYYEAQRIADEEHTPHVNLIAVLSVEELAAQQIARTCAVCAREDPDHV